MLSNDENLLRSVRVGKNVNEIDAELGRLLALLREHDALESTIVIVSSLAPVAPPRCHCCHPDAADQECAAFARR